MVGLRPLAARSWLLSAIDRSIDTGVNAVVAWGSTGEFAALNSDERLLVVDSVVRYTAERVPVVAQTGTTSTKESIRCPGLPRTAGANVLMLVTPAMKDLPRPRPTTTIGLARRRWTCRLCYNIPAFTGINCTRKPWETWRGKRKMGQYIKDSSGDVNHGEHIWRRQFDPGRPYRGPRGHHER